MKYKMESKGNEYYKSGEMEDELYSTRTLSFHLQTVEKNQNYFYTWQKDYSFPPFFRVWADPYICVTSICNFRWKTSIQIM